MGVYYILLGVTLFFVFLELNTSVINARAHSKIRSLSFFCIFLFILLLGICRYEFFGVDYLSYKISYFDKYRLMPFSAALKSSEPGFSCLIWLFGLFSEDYWLFRALVFAFSFILISRYIYRESSFVSLSFLGFFCFSLIGFYFNILRQSIAVSISLYAIPYLRKRQFKKYVAVVLLSCLFHRSALVMLFAYFHSILKFKKLNRFKLPVLFLIIAVFFPFLSKIIVVLIRHIFGLNYELVTGKGSWLLIYYLVHFALIRLLAPSKMDNKMRLEYEFSFCCVYVQAMAISYEALARAGNFFSYYFICLFLPDFACELRGHNRFLFAMIAIASYLFMFVLNYLMSKNSIVPYVSHFQ